MTLKQPPQLAQSLYTVNRVNFGNNSTKEHVEMFWTGKSQIIMFSKCFLLLLFFTFTVAAPVQLVLINAGKHQNLKNTPVCYLLS